MQFIFSPVLGSLSDRFGRRKVILLSNFGLGLDYLLMALAPTLPWLFVGRVASGITSSSFPTAIAYIADVTPPEQRAGKFGLLGAAFGLGFIVGPTVGGLLASYSLRAPFWVAAVLSLANCRVRLLHPAGVAAGEPAVAVPLAASDPDRIAADASRAAAAARARVRGFPLDARARFAADDVRALRELSVSLGRARHRPGARRGRRGGAHRARRAGRQAGLRSSASERRWRSAFFRAPPAWRSTGSRRPAPGSCSASPVRRCTACRILHCRA